MKIALSRLGGTLAASAVGLFALVSCAQAVGSVSLANAISDQLQKQSIDAQGVACPGDLQAAVGQTERCSFTVGGQPVDAIATVTSVDNGNVKYDITTEAHPIAKELLARKVVEQVTQQTRMPVDSATCGSDLQPTVNAIANCTLVNRAKPVPVMVTVTKVSGGLINFSIKQV
ncbi:MAG TPA: DUF4333 domain-containing protein [Pseudonocardia sp.]